jgi:hypothetical protein
MVSTISRQGGRRYPQSRDSVTFAQSLPDTGSQGGTPPVTHQYPIIYFLQGT